MTLSLSLTPLGLSCLSVNQDGKHVDTLRLGLDTEDVITSSIAPTCPHPCALIHFIPSFHFHPGAVCQTPALCQTWRWGVTGRWLLSGSLLSADLPSHMFIHSSVPWLSRLHIHPFFLFFRQLSTPLFPPSLIPLFCKHSGSTTLL